MHLKTNWVELTLWVKILALYIKCFILYWDIPERIGDALNENIKEAVKYVAMDKPVIKKLKLIQIDQSQKKQWMSQMNHTDFELKFRVKELDGKTFKSSFLFKIDYILDEECSENEHVLIQCENTIYFIGNLIFFWYNAVFLGKFLLRNNTKISKLNLF